MVFLAYDLMLNMNETKKQPCNEGREGERGGGRQKYQNHNIYTISKSVAVRKLQVAILARSSREMSQTVCID